MPHAETHRIVFTKDSQRNLQLQAITNHTSHILKAVGKGMQQRGWSLQPHNFPADHMNEWRQDNWIKHTFLDEGPNAYRYELHFDALFAGDEPPAKSELRAIAKQMQTRSNNPLGGRWTLATIDEEAYEVTDGETLSTKDFTAYAELDVPDDFEEAFSHLYGLESHIGRLKLALEVAQMSSFANRYHVALIGKPGCGKSDICETLANMLGDDVVMKFDATATTAAGAIKQLDEADIMPRILVVEEIEKVNAEALSFLLALMDLRGEIRKTTARGKIHKDTKILVIATVNNHELFDNMLAGALSSRFANKLWFHRPSVEVITRILSREIAKLNGDEAWIKPTIEYARDKEIDDPRMITALCLCGRDGWLDGTFVKMLLDTDKPKNY